MARILYIDETFSVSLLDGSDYLIACSLFFVSNTVASFTDLSRTVAENWKSIDKETKDYCHLLARIIKERHTVLSEAERRQYHLSMMESVGVGQKKTMKQQSAEINHKTNSDLTKSGGILFIPAMDVATAESAKEKKRREAKEKKRRELQSMIQMRKRKSIRGHQQKQYSVAHEQGVTCSHDDTMNCATRMYGQYHNMFTDSSTAIMSGYGNLAFSNADMPCPIPTSICTQQGTQETQMPVMCSHDNSRTDLMRINQQYQDYQMLCTKMAGGYSSLDFSNVMMPCPIQSVCSLQGIQEAQMPIMKRSHSDIELRFPIITNVSQRALISNMMNPVHYSSGRPFETSKQECFSAMNETHELDVSDSDIIGMWMSSEAKEGD